MRAARGRSNFMLVHKQKGFLFANFFPYLVLSILFWRFRFCLLFLLMCDICCLSFIFHPCLFALWCRILGHVTWPYGFVEAISKQSTSAWGGGVVLVNRGLSLRADPVLRKAPWRWDRKCLVSSGCIYVCVAFRTGSFITLKLNVISGSQGLGCNIHALSMFLFLFLPFSDKGLVDRRGSAAWVLWWWHFIALELVVRLRLVIVWQLVLKTQQGFAILHWLRRAECLN